MTLETKIQIEALKARENLLAVSYSQYNGFTYLTTDGLSAVKIPNVRFLLDKSKLNESKALADIFNVCKDDLYKLENTYYRRPYKKGVAVCFESELSKSETDVIYCDEKILKKLSVKGAEILADKFGNRIYLAADGEIYAVMLPLIFREPEENEC